jgi:hypothetical protein
MLGGNRRKGKAGELPALPSTLLCIPARKEIMLQLTFRKDGLATEETRASIILGDIKDIIRAL